MTELGLRAYVPIEIRRRQGKGVVHEFRRPLIPGYVFVRGADGVPMDLLRHHARHAIGWLLVDGAPAAISSMQIDLIREMAHQHNKALSDRRTLSPGDTVRPTRGPFSSIEVLLRSVRGSTATIEVQMLGSTREAKVSVSDLEKVA